MWSHACFALHSVAGVLKKNLDCCICLGLCYLMLHASGAVEG